MMDQDMSARIAALSNLSQDELRARFSAHPLTTTADELRDAASAHEPGTLADAREALADAREALARMAWAATDAPSRCACYAPDVRADVARAYAALTAALPQDADDDQRCVQRAVDELAERFAQGLTSDAMPSHHVNAAIACIDAGDIAQAIHWLELWWKGAQIAGDRKAETRDDAPPRGTSSKRGAVSVTVRTPDRTDELTNVADWFLGVGGALVVIHERDGYEVRSSYSDYLGYEVVTRKDDEDDDVSDTPEMPPNVVTYMAGDVPVFFET